MRRVKRENLDRLFNPGSVAVLGASANPSKLGFHVMKSLVEGGYRGRIIPVNPGLEDVMGRRAYPSITALDAPIDLAVVAIPAGGVAGVFSECREKGVGGVVLITAGYKEIDDPEGARLHDELFALAESAGIPVIGPNTFGLINFRPALNASFTPEFSRIRPGGIALVSQSGGMAHLLGFSAEREGIGLRLIVGLGNRLNVDFPEILDYLVEDSHTEVIALYVEGMDRARDLLRIGKEVRGRKPVIAYKTGCSEKGNAASLSHTGSLAGRAEIYRGAFLQCGILPVDNAEALLDGARALSACPPPKGSGIGVLTAQAGPGMAASDRCERGGLRIPSFSATTQERINALLPPLALRTNPVDMGPAWYDPGALSRVVGAVMEDIHVRGILVLMMFASANMDVLAGLAPLLKEWGQKKPVVSCILSPRGIWDGLVEELEASRALVNYPTPERAAAAMVNLWRYGQALS